jgi:putative nucleotidyltransferase with HDIG domain
LHDESANYRVIGEIISTDAALTAQVLRLANSALFGCPGEVKSLIVALNLLGMDRVFSLVLTASLKKMVGKVSGWPLARRCWRHSVATAFLAADLSVDHFREISEDYTAGLLHDLGRLILLASAPADYSALVVQAAETNCDSRSAERLLFGVTHEDTGAEAMRRFGFPDSLIRQAAYHHGCGHSTPLPWGFVACCCRTATLCGFSTIDPQDPIPAGPDDICLFIQEKMLEVERQLAA